MAVKVKKSAATGAAKSANAEKQPKDKSVKSATKEAKAPKEKSEKREKKAAAFTARLIFAADLMAKQKLTDEEIIARVNEKFPEYAGKPFDQKECHRTRWMIGSGKMPADYDMTNKAFGRVFEIDGKRYTKEERPKKTRAKKEKIDPAKDPLRNVAGIDPNKASAKKAKVKRDASGEAKAEAKAEAAADTKESA